MFPATVTSSKRARRDCTKQGFTRPKVLEANAEFSKKKKRKKETNAEFSPARASPSSTGKALRSPVGN